MENAKAVRMLSKMIYRNNVFWVNHESSTKHVFIIWWYEKGNCDVEMQKVEYCIVVGGYHAL